MREWRESVGIMCSFESQSNSNLYLVCLFDKIFRFSRNKQFVLICAPRQDDSSLYTISVAMTIQTNSKHRYTVQLMNDEYSMLLLLVVRSVFIFQKTPVLRVASLSRWTTCEISTQIKNGLRVSSPFARDPNSLMRASACGQL